MLLNIILNWTQDNIIGINNELLFHIKEDLEWFKKITTGHIVVMGYNTWKSLPIKPLKDRYNIVITNEHYDEFLEYEGEECPDQVFRSYQEMIDYFFTSRPQGKVAGDGFREEVTMFGSHSYLVEDPNIFIIGGSRLYEEAYQEGIVDTIYETKCIINIENCDDCFSICENDKVTKCNLLIDKNNYEITYYKKSKSNVDVYHKVEGENKKRKKKELNYIFFIHQKKKSINQCELQYLRLLNKVYSQGTERNTRNSIVKSSFGEKMTFNLIKGFPLLTSKKMGWKTILRELLWFINGSTNNKELQEKNVHIWDENSSKEYMESRGLTYEEGELGPIYGWQWRNFGGEYGVKEGKKGVDQIKYMINLIKTDPMSRRIILSSWNPPDLNKMALPPCHILFQIYVDGEFIDGQLYQRSGDMFLGVPFNIASYSFLLHIIGKVTNKKPRFLHHILGDCHIYSNHYKQVEEQLMNKTFNFPNIEINDELTSIDTIKESDINIINYQSNNSIKAVMIA